MMYLRASETAAVEQMLAAANGRRRERLADIADAAQVIREAALDGYGSRRSAGVGASYGYRAYGTAVAAARATDGTIKIVAYKQLAGRNPEPWYDGSRTHEKVAANALRWANTPDPSAVILSAHTARSIIAAQARAAREAMRDAPATDHAFPPTVIVTRRDSIRAGNCPRQTDYVRSLVGDACPADKLRALLIARAPHLLPYARRAVAIAAARAHRVNV